MKQSLIIAFCITTLFAQDNFIGDVFDRGKIDYGNRTIQAIGIGFIPSNVINAGQARRSAMRIAKQGQQLPRHIWTSFKRMKRFFSM